MNNLFRLHCAALALVATAAQAQSFDAGRWQQDFAQLRHELASTYANLDWMVAERRVDLKAMVTRTEADLAAAGSDEAAARVLKQFLDSFGDGHVRLLPPQKTPTSPGAEAKAPTTNPAPARACHGLGYRAPRSRGIDFTRFDAFEVIDNPDARALPAGILKTGSTRIGVLRIGLFGEDGYPMLCEQFHPLPAACDHACARTLAQNVGRELTQLLARQMRVLAARGVDGVVIDLTGNGGGSEWVEAAARVVTAPGLAMPRVGFIRHAHWEKSLQYRLNDIDLDLRKPVLAEAQRNWLTAARAKVERAMAEVRRPCDRAGVWENRPVCPLLVSDFLHTAGIDAVPANVSLEGFEAQWVHDNAARYGAVPGAYRGPLAILIDGATASAAEQFAAMLKDNGRAALIGSRTYGAGCGYTNGGIPITLRHSGIRIRVPDCARLRADGQNEVAGIAADIVTAFGDNLTAAQRAERARAGIAAWSKGLPAR